MAADLKELSQRIRSQLDRAVHRLKELRGPGARERRRLEVRYHEFHELAARLVRELIYPRVQHVSGHFANSQVSGPDRQHGHHCICRFKQTPRFPAAAKLDIGFAHDAQVENLLVLFDVEIRPVYMRYDRGDQLSIPMGEVDEARLAKWMDDRLVDFVEAYLRLEFVDRCQNEILVTDPVSAARFSKISAASEAIEQGRTFYFVSKENREKFLRKPAAFVHPSDIEQPPSEDKRRKS